MPCFGSHLENGRYLGFYSNPHPLWTPENMALTPFTTNLKTLGSTKTYIYNTTKFHEILSCSSWDLPWTSSCFTERKEKNKNNNNKNKNNNKKRSKNNKSPKLCLGDLINIAIRKNSPDFWWSNDPIFFPSTLL